MARTADKSVLFVHNDKSWHELGERFTVDSGGWRVLHAAGIDSAQRIIASENVGVGMIDLRDCTQPTCDDVSARMALLRASNRHLPWLGVLSPESLDTDVASSLASNFSDYLTAPLDPVELRIVVTHAYRMSQIIARARDETVDIESQMVGASAAMHTAFESLRKMASSDAPVLISGESGTGKELAANAIHRRSRRAQGPFVEIDCGAVPPTLIHSELFGYEKGAFTGAAQRKIGRIESAQGGTLFLDEIGDLPIDSQGYLLRFLQESTIQRVGGLQPIHVDARVIAATHLNLEHLITAGHLREDLYYRLNVVQLKLPPLRERKADVELLAKFFLNKFTQDSQQPGKSYTPASIEAMSRYAWPGNIRELINRVRRAVVMCDGRWITPANLDLPEPLVMAARVAPNLTTARLAAEKEAICAALQIHNGNISRAARALSVSRVTLYRLMQRNGLIHLQADGGQVPAGGMLKPDQKSTLFRSFS